MIGALFWLLTAVGCSYAALLGGRSGRCAAMLILGASLLTIPATRLGYQWEQTEFLLLAVDLALLAGLISLSLKSRRFFPIWMAGFHLIAVLTHISTMISPEFTPKIYRAVESLWAVPMTFAMMWGIHMDRLRSKVPKKHREQLSSSPRPPT